MMRREQPPPSENPILRLIMRNRRLQHATPPVHSQHQRKLTSASSLTSEEMNALVSSIGDRCFRERVGGLLETGQYSDAMIECEGNIFRVHKAIICPQSDFFAHAFDSNSGFKEAKTSTIQLHEIHPDTVRAIVEYLYHGKYVEPDSKDEQLTLVVNVYSAAEMYQLVALKEYALQKLKARVRDVFTLETFPAAVKTIYESTVEQDRGLRDAIIDAAVSKIDDITTRTDSKFNDTLKEVASFGRDIILGLQNHRQQGSGKSMLRCPSADCSEMNEMCERFESLTWYPCRWCFREYLGEHWMGTCRCFSDQPGAVDCDDY
ncbi:BTB/POZ protein [Phyllosticta capitalensis]|uniref:BTB/POZ protein n=1 Tax=Phyllosticta capitalensis TaxID=121624 RepID=A0ABR1YK04_9PEZI